MEGERGQATIETVALLPILLLLAVAAWQGLLIGWTALEAQQAARAGARAALGGERPAPAVGSSLPGSMRDEVEIHRAGGRLTVRVRVPSVVPGFRLSLSASAVEVGE
jgi:hypothetical protein